VDWKGILMAIFQAALQFGAAYGASRAMGTNNAAALAAGGAALGTGQVALFSNKPSLTK
jgi:hypothetical protein